ncbi:catechol 2,3-dioxygenase-like lactoylglutathione lyase family enzyme [Actinoplanes octamycinicus]|uniref:Catechol 2,3-dioxygenase-like lactoylglutathione lyase family enzyme n=1 Tax=Actinoplanes octamycinicus TaxID=135948 RepID=A0A7W7M968_9ACTN|nr:VOC family protein [Actinoplanes octamycinicus]MBB4741708.1 catechol 2,3-dioxygenase-like lactoylglutathione lyase family enzyme [Actinoplanes octamycinicus]GIE57261.1 hypothetical protein Aoc01nite_26630 [Actinoplanes octamycinicus]
MRIRRISWLGVKTDSYQETRDFFADVAGLDVAYEKPDFAVFRMADGDLLEVFGPDADDPPEQFAAEKVVAGLLVDDIDEATATLRAAGIELLGPQQSGSDGYRWQHFRLPDGKVFELSTGPGAD